MERTIKVIANGVEIGEVLTNHSLTVIDIMWALGYDITDSADLERGYKNKIEGFYLDDCGNYCFDEECITTENEE